MKIHFNNKPFIFKKYAPAGVIDKTIGKVVGGSVSF